MRQDRGYDLTDDGEKLQTELSALDVQLDRLIQPPTQNVQPLIKISAGTWSTLALLNNLDHLIGTPEDLRIRFVSTEAHMDISHRDVVIGIRNRPPDVPHLTQRKLARVHYAPYATLEAPHRWIRVLLFKRPPHVG